MHELALTHEIVEIVCRAAGNRRVHKVILSIGRLSGVVPDSIEFCFDVVAQRTQAEGAELEIRLIDGRARCETCGSEFVTETLYDRCRCGSRKLIRLAGDELEVTTMELEEAA